jgi:hypothetical protein
MEVHSVCFVSSVKLRRPDKSFMLMLVRLSHSRVSSSGQPASSFCLKDNVDAEEQKHT